jgi:NADH-quinone oxidoreductase subunit A
MNSQWYESGHELENAVGPPLAAQGAQFLTPYVAILIVLGIVVVMAIVMLVLAHAIGPKRTGAVKGESYESGMPLIEDARRRFNVRFYIVAMLFLLFDVEVVFLWPWARVFYDAAMNGTTVPLGDGVVGAGFLLGGMAVFFVILLVGYAYEWRKGAFKWD